MAYPIIDDEFYPRSAKDSGMDPVLTAIPRWVARGDVGGKRMSAAIERFVNFLQLSDKMLSRAERADTEECARVLVEQCAHYRSPSGEIPMSETLEALDGEMTNDGQAN
jgi:hypothetical protein